MVNSTEALKMALEVNESMKDVLKQVNELIAENKALKEALAQEQEPVAWMLDGEFYKTQQFHLQGGHYANQIPLYTTPPQRTEQEPVALPCCGYADSSAIKWNPYSQVVQCHNCGQVYTHPPQRTWVGLMDEEIDLCFEDHGWSPSKDYYPVIKDIEAKLKELNT